jgi:sec-independent protein translocase protein TatA
MFGNLFSGWHIVILVALVLLLFGATKLPALAKGLGESLRILRTETRKPANGQSDEQAADPASDPAGDPPAAPAVGETGSAAAGETGSAAAGETGRETAGEAGDGTPGEAGADPAQRD